MLAITLDIYYYIKHFSGANYAIVIGREITLKIIAKWVDIFYLLPFLYFNI